MKKTKILCMILIVSVVFLSSCGTHILYHKTGIENFRTNHSEMDLTRYLILDDFLEMFPYVDGDYDYCEKSVGGFGYETALLYMVYDENTYYEAKEYALKNLKVVENSEEEYEGYIFLIRDLDHTYEGSLRIYFAYSDQDRILLAIGTVQTRVSDYKDNSLKEYIEINFPFYDFEEGKINHPT